MKINAAHILFAVFALLAVAAHPCLAQPASRTVVTFSDGTACAGSPAPSFDALSVVVKANSPTSAAGAGPGSRVTFDDVAITRNVDDCSVPLYVLIFQQQLVRTVTISFQNMVAGSYKEALRITLNDVLLDSLSDTESNNVVPQEKITLKFHNATIFDPVTGKATKG
jgi:hypothetical protein